MDLIFRTLNVRLIEINGHRELSAKLKTFTDEQRVIYTFNLLEKFGIQPESTCFQKDTEKSVNKRIKGNKIYTSRFANAEQYVNAWEMYSESIAYALPGSEELALAYGNRSAVLFRLKKYKECLEDIERALSSNYPDDSRPKLLLRREMCFKVLGELDREKKFQETHQLMEKMSVKEGSKAVLENMVRMIKLDELRGKVNEKEYPLPEIASCNPEVPVASDGVQIKYDDIFGRHLVATRDIKPGEILVVEKPYALVLAPERRYTHCAKCLTIAWNGIPCDHCVYAMFCSEKCKEDAWKEFHDIECPVVGLLLNLQMDTLGLLSMRLAIIITRKMGSLEALRKELEIVDNWKDPRTRGYSDDGKFDNENYRAVYSLMTNADKRSMADIFGRALNTTYILFFLATRTEMFGKKLKASLPALLKSSKFTFVGGMILHHQQMIPINTYMFSEEREHECVITGAALTTVSSLFNHSCNPNVDWNAMKQQLVFSALYPIKKDEQLFVSYGFMYVTMEKEARQKKLKEQFYFECRCQPCEENWPMYFELMSYTRCITSRRKVAIIKKALRNLNRYKYLADVGDIESDPDMLKNLFKMTEVLSECAPCKEYSDVIETIKRVIALRGNSFFILKLLLP
ncbi:SET and MYND domain-containing protein 4 [Orussus abietinus]|uniref:SET and MYND domain-containing protein 4 n=1 Tax=Orussus abietinus TaxID=222816 RepID=UPI00062544BA|nr:SET and MYND domain-containing protein 4 [Orussus abietinus]